MSHEPPDEPAPARAPWRRPAGWLALLGAGWALYELTHSPGLAVVLICLKFGWEDFRAARWLYRRDPSPLRRRSLFWLYLAWGLWKVALVAFLMTIAFASVTPRNPVPQAVPQALRAFLGTFLTALVGFGLSTLMTLLAVVYAARAGVRLWLDAAVHRARRHDFWPPTPFCLSGANRLGLLLLTAVALAGLVGCGVLLALVPPGEAGLLVALALTLAAPVAVILGRDLLSEMVWARSPEECWPEEWDPEQQWQGGPRAR